MHERRIPTKKDLKNSHGVYSNALKELSSNSISEMFEKLVAVKIQSSDILNSDDTEKSTSVSISEMFERLVESKIQPSEPDSFIKQLTNKQIADFLDKLYPKNEGFDVSFCLRKNHDSSEEYWSVKILRFDLETPIFIRLEEYNSTILQPGLWRQYLCNIFGDEYKKAYFDNYASLLDED